jgi:hypothetical protein
MLTSQEIIAGLQSIVNNNFKIAIIWHIILYVMITGLLFKWVPTNRLFLILLCIPLASVAILALTSGNPFNGTLFTGLVLILFILGLKASANQVTYSQLPFIVTGILMVGYAIIYPHFLETNSLLKYLYASPVGLIPCPTLSLLIGFALIFNGFGSNGAILALIIYGLFYGIFGVLKLAVNLDIGLIVGTLLLLVKYIMSFSQVR